MVNLSDLIPKREDKNDVGALAGLRSVSSEQSIELTSPNNTLIKTDHPSFSWIAKKSFDNYVVNLYNSKGLVWSKKVSENAMKYPENEKGLEFGESYFWNVEGEYLIDTDKSSNHKFSVLSLEQSKEVEENENTIRNTFKNDPESSSMHSVMGAYFINKGLLQDAIIEFQTIAKLNSDAALPHELLGSLYSEVGDKDKAIDELQKALTLSKNREK
jgi:tetratricopeptide (TPR) repeat protein